MAIQYSGNTQTTTFSPASKQDIINSVGAALITAGWTTVSGGSGTTAWKLQSATTPQGYAIRVLMKDNGGNCITFSLESSDGTLVGPNSTSSGGFLIPGGYTYKMVLCKYQCFIYAVPYIPHTRTFVAFGVPAVLSFLTGGISRVGWLQACAQTDSGDFTNVRSMRDSLYSSGQNTGGCQCHLNNNLWSASVGSGIGYPQLMGVFNNCGSGTPTLKYQNGAAVQYDAVIGFGATGPNDPGLYVGQLWDAICTSDVYSADSLCTLADGHNYTSMQGIANNQSVGTLCLAVS